MAHRLKYLIVHSGNLAHVPIPVQGKSGRTYKPAMYNERNITLEDGTPRKVRGHMQEFTQKQWENGDGRDVLSHPHQQGQWDVWALVEDIPTEREAELLDEIEKLKAKIADAAVTQGTLKPVIPVELTADPATGVWSSPEAEVLLASKNDQSSETQPEPQPVSFDRPALEKLAGEPGGYRKLRKIAQQQLISNVDAIKSAKGYIDAILEKQANA